jgi:hypothetical protein
MSEHEIAEREDSIDCAFTRESLRNNCRFDSYWFAAILDLSHKRCFPGLLISKRCVLLELSQSWLATCEMALAGEISRGNASLVLCPAKHRA